MADPKQPTATDPWSNRRIILLAVVVAVIFYAVFRLPTTITYILARARDTLILLILSVALAYFLLPVVNALCKIPVKLTDRTKRSTASLIAILVFLGLVVLLTSVTLTPIVSETGKVLQTVSQWAQHDLPGQLQGLTDSLLSRLPLEYRLQVEQQIEAAEAEWTAERITETISARIQDWGKAILEWQVNLIASVLSSGRYLMALLIVPVFTYYFLADATSIRTGIQGLVPAEARERYHLMLTDMDTVIQRYVKTVMTISLMTGVATALTLYVAGVDVFLTFGILAGIANMVPVLGAIAAVIAITAISLLQVGLKTTIIVMIVYTAIQLVTDRVIAPKMMAEGAQLHPVAVLLGLLVGAEFFGMVGVFVAIPVLAAARVGWIHYREYMNEGDHSKELDSLLGRERPAPAAPAPDAVADEMESTTEADEADDEAVNGDEDADEHA